MKKFIYTAWSIVIGATLTSCELDTIPTDSVSYDIVFEDAENAEKVLNGTWAYLMDTYTTYQNPGWTSLLRASDAMGNDVAMQPAKYGYISHYSFTNVSGTSSTTVRGIWTLGYKAIDNTNHLITKIDALPGDSILKRRTKAQAYALRGYIYLNLVTFFSRAYDYNPQAPSVPIYITPTTSSTTGAPRSTVEEVYKRAEDDLLEAYNTIGDYDRETSKHKFDKHVIAGVLARLYLQKKDWTNAQKFAAEAHEGYSWMSKNDYLNGFNDQSNAEWIWGHGQTTDQDVASYNFHFLDVSSGSSYYYSFMADPHFKDLFDALDVRTGLFEWDVTRYKGGLMYKKFKFRSDNTADIVLMRKAEMVLIEAEAYAEKNEQSKAIEKLNELRVTRGAETPDLSGKSKEDLIEEILIERRKELFGEGFSLSDINRLQKAVQRTTVPDKTYVPGTTIQIKGHTVTKLPKGEDPLQTGPIDFIPNSSLYLFAIPLLESQNNPNL